MKFKNRIYLKSGTVLEFNGDKDNLARESKDISDWNNGNLGIWENNEMIIPRREIEFIESMRIEEVTE